MAFCGSCGNELRSGARFCAVCGQATGSGTPGPTKVASAKTRTTSVAPPEPLPQPEPSEATPNPKRSAVALIVALSVLAIAIGVAVGLVLVGGGDEDGSTTASADAEPTEVSSPPEVTEPDAAPITTSSTAPPDPEAEALQALEDQVDSDRSLVEADLAGTWVPQISSKALGITDEVTGITYGTYESILQDHLHWRGRFDVALIDSADFASFDFGTDFYVTVAVEPFPTSDGAIQWCDQHALSSNDCFAKFISHTAGEDQQVYR